MTIYVREGWPEYRYERHAIRQVNLFSIEWRLPHVAATICCRAVDPVSERCWPVFRRFRFFHFQC